MKYTSAAEGFYGFIRVPLTREKDRDVNLDDKSSFSAPASRLGVRGSLDLGGGLSATYRYEWDIQRSGGDFASVRLRQIGLKGELGEVIFGQQWGLDYDYVFRNIDIANWGDGSIRGFRALRLPGTVRYNSKTLNGVKFSAQAQMLGNDDGNEIDRYLAGASWTKNDFYAAAILLREADCAAGCGASINGVMDAADREIGGQAADLGLNDAQLAAAARTDTVVEQDRRTIGAAFSYRGADWRASYLVKKADIDGVAAVAVEDNGAPGGGDDTVAVRFDQSGDEIAHGFAFQYAYGKLTWRGVYEAAEQDTGFGKYHRDIFIGEVQYDFGRRTRAWLGYRDEENDVKGQTDSVFAGYRVDF